VLQIEAGHAAGIDQHWREDSTRPYGSTAFIMHKIPPAQKDAEAVYDLKQANLNALLRAISLRT